MSGDVQPRKRKEKRRKKDDEDTGTPPPTLINPTDTCAENVTIHIYKESSTGGHWCARIIFFVLLAVLAGLIGIIIFEYRGITNVDTPIASSRWASIFEGWVDDSLSHHGDVSYELEEKLEESEEMDEEKEREDEEEKKVSHDEEKSTKIEKEEDDESVEQDIEGISEEETEEEEEEREEQEEEEEEEIEEEIEEEEEDEEEEDERQEEEEEEEKEKGKKDNIETADEDQNQEERKRDENIAEEVDEGYDDDDDDDVDDDDDDDQEFDDVGILEEVDETNENEDLDEENNISDHPDMELDEFSTEITDNFAEEKNNDVSEEFPSIPGVNEMFDNSAEPLEEVEDEEAEEENLNDADSELEEEKLVEEEPTSVAVKFGVGVALVVAAHFVLVRRWNNVDIGTFRSPSDITNIPDLSRRETIISPPHLKRVIKTIEKVGNKTPLQVQVKNYEDLRSKYHKLQLEDISLTDLTKPISQDKAAQVKEKWSARSTTKEETNIRHGQSKISSEEEEEEDYELETSEDERVSGVEEFEDGEQVKDEDEEEDDEEIENVDDSELIAKLDAKYGKLPTPQDSEVEEEEEEIEEEEEEEEGEEEEEEQEEEQEEQEEEVMEEKHDKMPKRKRVKELKGSSHEEPQARRPTQHIGKETTQVDSRQSNSGEKAHEFSMNISNIDDIITHEENRDSVESQVDKEFYN